MSLPNLSVLGRGIPLDPLPELRERSKHVPHAPKRNLSSMTEAEKKQALANALRYFPQQFHALLLPEFANELETYGHIYMYRFKPTEYDMKAYPISSYPAKLEVAKAIQLMIQNNLDPRVAQFPEELITYGGNGCVLSNWAQYHLLMKYLTDMTDNQTLAMYSGHPLGLFPAPKEGPRVVITNGMVIPNYSSQKDLDKMYALGVTMYGQMTAGSYCYIGPQGIVHGTTITILNAGRKYLGSANLAGKVFVSSGLGGMSGAQPKAATICGCVSVVAEVDINAVTKRHSQGWVMKVSTNLDDCVELIKKGREHKQPLSIAFHGNIVTLLERLAQEQELLVDLASDQTSCHNPYNGGYYPVDLTLEQANRMMNEDPVTFKSHVQASLRRHITAINTLSKRGMKFWDYGNSFLLECSRANADVVEKTTGAFIYPSYVEDIMGDIFSLGFGPFRWVCTSGDPEDLRLTDNIAGQICSELASIADPMNKGQYEDNLKWIQQANANNLVVGSQARILYSDAVGRAKIALSFNKAVRDKLLKGPVVISRDHHDVSGTDSPWRETSNIRDGSKFTADMAVQNFLGLGFRGVTWLALHNGGGTGWGEAINGGFGLVLDGQKDTDDRIKSVLAWDVNNGVARRAWAGNQNALWSIQQQQELLADSETGALKVTLPNSVDNQLLTNFKFTNC